METVYPYVVWGRIEVRTFADEIALALLVACFVLSLGCFVAAWVQALRNTPRARYHRRKRDLRSFR